MSTSPPATVADPLAPLAEATLHAIAASGVVRSFPKNAVLINEGDTGDSLFIVLAGRIKVYASNEAGKEFVIDFYGPGEYVGEMSLDGSPRSASVMTVEPTTCAIVTPRALPRVHRRQPGLRAAPDREADPTQPARDRQHEEFGAVGRLRAGRAPPPSTRSPAKSTGGMVPCRRS